MDSVILERKGTFENKQPKHIDESDVYGTTIKRKLHETDEKERYFHLFPSSAKEGEERALLAKKLRKMKAHLMKHTNEVIDFGSGFRYYYILYYNEQDGVFRFPEDRTDVIGRENDLSGYFCIITSEKMTAKEALSLYIRGS